MKNSEIIVGKDKIMKWKRLNKKQPKIGQKVIWRTFKDNSFYRIYYGTYLGILETYPNSQYYVHTFEMWFNSNIPEDEISKTKEFYGKEFGCSGIFVKTIKVPIKGGK